MNLSTVPPDSALTNMQEVVFDADFYHRKYPDLQAAFHHDNAKLHNHWNTYGIKEGRACSVVLDLKFYLEKHPDLQKAYGTDYQKVYDHVFRYGINEMRATSPMYDPNTYKATYPWLSPLTPRQLMWHFKNQGNPQGLMAVTGIADIQLPPLPPGTSEHDLAFDADFYHDKYPDLQAAYNHDNAKLRNHWNTYGIKEGRAGSPVLDLQHYLQYNPDLQKAYGTDYQKVYDHFIRYGMNELRYSSPEYNGKTYRDRYHLIGSGKQLIYHYLTQGRRYWLWAY